MAQILHLATAPPPEAAPDPDAFVETPTARDILTTLRLVEAVDGPAITMIAGEPGVGKTRALEEYAARNRGALLHTVAGGEASAWNLANGLLAYFGGHMNDKVRMQDLSRARYDLGRSMGDHILIIDEAQLLTRTPKGKPRGEALEWLRSLHDINGVKIVLCGNVDLSAFVLAEPQLLSRMLRPLILGKPDVEDVRLLSQARGISDPEAIQDLFAAISRSGRRGGGLRALENVLQVAALFAGGGKPDAAHVRAAITDLKLAGGRA